MSTQCNPHSDGLAHSIKQRLLNYARQRDEVFNMVLIRFAVERLLYRLTQSPHADQFVLKGAMLFASWADKPHRSTQDVDLLGFGDPSMDRLMAIFCEVCVTNVEPDGLVFDSESVRVEPIREDAVYDGHRVQMTAFLGNARIPIQVDVGFGDAITPGPCDMVFGPILDLPAPQLRAYPPETVIAEKLDAIVVRGMANSRMKDYYDLWTLSRTMPFSLGVLQEAVEATMQRRGTPLPSSLPIGLADDFAGDDAKQRQWAAFIRKMGDGHETPMLDEVVEQIRLFLEPVILLEDSLGREVWQPGGPWMPIS